MDTHERRCAGAPTPSTYRARMIAAAAMAAFLAPRPPSSCWYSMTMLPLLVFCFKKQKLSPTTRQSMGHPRFEGRMEEEEGEVFDKACR